jgi:hypothetical protein
VISALGSYIQGRAALDFVAEPAPAVRNPTGPIKSEETLSEVWWRPKHNICANRKKTANLPLRTWPIEQLVDREDF